MAQQQNGSRDTACYAFSRLVGTSLAQLPALQWVELTGQDQRSLGELTPESLESLCQSPSLTKLTLDHVELKDRHIVAMASALETSTTIEELKITCELGRTGCTALAQLLFVNTTSLNNFTLQLSDLTDKVPVPELEDTLNNDDNQQQHPQNDAIYEVAQALESNHSLQYFSLSGHATISKASVEAFATLLRANTTLLHCEIDLPNAPSLSDDLQQEAELMLKLNELGRKQLLQEQASRHQWVMTLWEVRRNLDGLYYILSRNPTLCDLPEEWNGRDKNKRRPTYSGLSHLQFKYLMS